MSEKEATARIKINRLLEAAGWRFFPEVRGDDLQLQADGGQHLSQAGVHFPAQALPLELDLAHGPAPASPTMLPGEGGKIPLRGLQPETMPQQAAPQVEHPGDLLVAGRFGWFRGLDADP